MEFWEWYDQIYNEWSNGGIKSENAFAAYLGVSQPTLNSYKNRTRGNPKSMEVITKIADKYPEIYSVLNIPRPGISIRDGESTSNANTEFAKALSERGITSDGPEFRKLLSEFMEKSGVKIKYLE